MRSSLSQRYSPTRRLLDGVRARERTAIGFAIQRYDGFLIGSVRNLLGAEHFAREGEDLLQEIRLAMTRALPSLRGQDARALRAWIKKVISSQYLDWVKRKTARRRSPERPVFRVDGTNVPEVSAPTPSPSQSFLEGEELRQLESAIEKASPRYREVLRFMSRNAPTQAEIAKFVRKEPEAARKFAGRALKDLRRALRGDT